MALPSGHWSRLTVYSLIILLNLLAQGQCQKSSSASNGISKYSRFDLFKNTGFQPCPINNTNTSSNPTDSDSIIVGITVKGSSPDDYCQWMTGTPIIIPTSPAAFFAGWPSFLTQAISLFFTYFGLWKTLHGLERNKKQHDMAIPTNFLDPITNRYRSHYCLSQRTNVYEAVSTRSPKPSLTLYSLVTIAVLLTILQWTVFLGAIVIHWRYNWWSISPIYPELSAVSSDPTSLGPIPQECLDYLSSGNLPAETFISSSAITAIGTQMSQFVITSFVTLNGLRLIGHDPYRRSFRMLCNSAVATKATLSLGSAALLGYELYTKSVHASVTNDQSVTGLCTFAVVQMWGLWGFYDVEYGRTFRLVLNAFGV